MATADQLRLRLPDLRRRKYWAGGGLPNWGNTAERLDIQTGQIVNSNTGDHMATPKRGGFDPYGNAWFGGGAGALVELDAQAQAA